MNARQQMTTRDWFIDDDQDRPITVIIRRKSTTSYSKIKVSSLISLYGDCMVLDKHRVKGIIEDVTIAVEEYKNSEGKKLGDDSKRIFGPNKKI